MANTADMIGGTSVSRGNPALGNQTMPSGRKALSRLCHFERSEESLSYNNLKQNNQRRIRELYRRVGNVGGIRHGAWMPNQAIPRVILPKGQDPVRGQERHE